MNKLLNTCFSGPITPSLSRSAAPSSAAVEVPVIFLLFMCGFCSVYAADDDFEYAVSLEKSGYIWLAEKEYSRIAGSESESRTTRIRVLSRLAHIYAAQGRLSDQEKSLKALAGMGKPDDPADIHFILVMAERTLSQDNEVKVVLLAESLDTAVSQDPRSEIADKLRTELEARTGRLISEYTKKYGAACEEGINPYSLAVGKTKYLQSFIFKEIDKEKHTSFLKALLREYFTAHTEREHQFAEVPFYRGFILEQLKFTKKAAHSFVKALSRTYRYTNQALRKKAFLRAVRNFYNAEMYCECAMIGLVYRNEFSLSGGKGAPDSEQDAIRCINTSLDHLKTSYPEKYRKIAEMTRKSRGGMTIQAARVSSGGVRRYVIRGSGGSSAVVEMPILKRR